MAGSVGLWFRRTYRLAPSDPRYLSLTTLEIMTEHYAYYYDDLRQQGKSVDEVEDDEFDLGAALNKTDIGEWETVIDGRPEDTS